MLFTTATHRYGANDATGRCYSAPVPLVSLLLVVVLTALGPLGCSPSKPAPGSGVTNAPASTLQAPTQSTAPLARLHWLGKKRLAAEPNATNFMAIWNLPESARLEAQTLDKLATAPWRLLPGVAPLSNAPTALLRPLLDDLVQEECYLEVAGDTNRPTEFVLAVRLPDDRAALWQTNLPVILTSLGPIGGEGRVRGQSAAGSAGSDASSPAPNSQLPSPSPSFTLQTPDLSLQLSRSGDWTLLSVLRAADLRPPTSDFPLLASVRSCIATNAAPFLGSATNMWIEADVELGRLRDCLKLNWERFPALPRLNLAVHAETGVLKTTGELVFPAALPLKLEAWDIPTNIIHDPLVSFTAVRAAAPWLRAALNWSEPDLGTAPDQFFFWAQSPALWQHFLTYPVANGSNHVAVVGEYILRELNPLFRTNRVGSFEWATNAQALVWKGLPYFVPRLETMPAHGRDFVVAGLFANRATNQPMPAGLFAEFQNNPKLVYFDWELSPPQVASWTQMGQLLRLVFGRAQLSPNTAGLPWLRAITPNLANATTVATLTDSNRITFRRSSTCGLTAIELHLLTDWLESPQFPRGLRSLEEVRRVPPPGATPTTNAPAPPSGP